MTQRNVIFLDELDSRQFYSREVLAATNPHQWQVACVHYEFFHSETDHGPHIDLTLYSKQANQLLFLLGLPLQDAGRPVWPGMFQDWPAEVLNGFADEYEQLAQRLTMRAGSLYEVMPFTPLFGATADKLVDGRTCPGLQASWPVAQVIQRYRFVTPIVQGRVLEVATGPGMGACMMLSNNRQITEYYGADLDALAIDLARRSNADPRANFHLGDFNELDGLFDTVMSLETIEHTPDPEQFMADLHARLKPDGTMIISLPNERWHGTHLNPHHWTCWNYARTVSFAQQFFEEVEVQCYDRPSFKECPYDIAKLYPYAGLADVSNHEGYLLVLRKPKVWQQRSRVVVKRTSARGDVLQTTPIVAALRQMHPDRRLVMWTEMTEVYADNPDVDILVCCHGLFKPAEQDQLIDLDLAYESSPRQHMLLSYAQRAAVAPRDSRLKLNLTPLDYRLVIAHVVQPDRLDDWRYVEKVVTLHMSSTPDRNWPAEYWDLLLQMLMATPQLGVLVVGAGRDHTPPAHPRIINLVGKLDFRNSAAAVAIADLLVGTDSGMLHVAGATGTPAVGLYGMVKPETRIPLGAVQTALVSPVDCAGCLHQQPAPNTDPHCLHGRGKAFCMDHITPDKVYLAIQQALATVLPWQWQLRAHLGGAHAVSPPQIAVDREARANAAAQTAPLLREQPFRAGDLSSALGEKEEVPVDPIEDAYAQWQQIHTLQGIDGQLMAERVQKQWRHNPVIHLLVWIDPGQEGLLADTVDSLSGQLFGEWRLSVVSPLPCPDPVFTELPILHWETVNAEDKTLALSQEVARVGADWFALVPPGLRLEPHTLLRIGDYANLKPEWALIYTDEDDIAADGKRQYPRFKPDFNLDMLRSTYYLGPVFARRNALPADQLPFQMPGAEEHDLALRLLDAHGEAAIGHITDVLVHWPQALPRVVDEYASQLALSDHLQRAGIAGEVLNGYLPGTFRVAYQHPTQASVTIIIPNKDKIEFLEPCLDSLLDKTDYPNYDVIVVDNQSTDPDLFEYYEQIRAAQPDRVRILDYPHEFNYSAICNLAASEAKGEYVLFLNNDTQILHPEWLSRMMAHAQRPEVGVVGARLSYPETGKIQHAGVIVGMDAIAEHVFIGQLGLNDPGYMNRALVEQNYTAVTGACQLVRKSLYEQVGGQDAVELTVSYNDIDLCLKTASLGFKTVWTPFATLIHHGSVSQKSDVVDFERQARKHARFKKERETMTSRWLPQLAHDPAYNPHLSLVARDMRVDAEIPLNWDVNFHDRPRVLARPLNGGSGDYRVVQPCAALSEAGLAQTECLRFPPNKGRLLTVTELARQAPDILIAHAALTDTELVAFDYYKRHLPGIRRIFMLDDLVTQVPEKSSVYKSFMRVFRDAKARLRKMLALSDRLIVSTDFLAETCAGMIDDIAVVPNRLRRDPWTYLTSRRGRGSKPRVGWAGAQQHLGDLQLIEPVVKALANEVEWVFMGMCPDPIRPFVKEFHSFVSIEDYPAKLASLDLDLALAPLEDNPFNQAKSNLRLLEYGALAWPVVCTDIDPYRAYDAPVCRLPNDPEAWIAAIRQKLADPAALTLEGQALKAWVHRHFILEDHLDEWARALLK